jgi:hypothetical protein
MAEYFGRRSTDLDVFRLLDARLRIIDERLGHLLTIGGRMARSVEDLENVVTNLTQVLSDERKQVQGMFLDLKTQLEQLKTDHANGVVIDQSRFDAIVDRAEALLPVAALISEPEVAPAPTDPGPVADLPVASSDSAAPTS